MLVFISELQVNFINFTLFGFGLCIPEFPAVVIFVCFVEYFKQVGYIWVGIYR